MDETGSSATMRSGWTASAPGDAHPLPLATAQVSWVYTAEIRYQLSTILSRSATRSGRSARVPMSWTFSTSASASPTLILGFSEEYGSWKTIWNRRRRSLSSRPDSRSRSTPSKVISPAVGSSRHTIIRARVDFPQPLSPTTPTISPRRHVQRDAVDGAQFHLPAGVRLAVVDSCRFDVEYLVQIARKRFHQSTQQAVAPASSLAGDAGPGVPRARTAPPRSATVA